MSNPKSSAAYSATEKKLAKRLRKLAYDERKIIIKHHLALKMIKAHASSRGDASNELYVCMILEAEYGAAPEEIAHG